MFIKYFPLKDLDSARRWPFWNWLWRSGRLAPAKHFVDVRRPKFFKKCQFLQTYSGSCWKTLVFQCDIWRYVRQFFIRLLCRFLFSKRIQIGKQSSFTCHSKRTQVFIYSLTDFHFLISVGKFKFKLGVKLKTFTFQLSTKNSWASATVCYK